MKMQSFVGLAIAGLLMATGTAFTVSGQSGQAEMQKPDKMMMMKGAAVKSGNFVQAEHPTQGMARIVRENGKTYVELDKNFKTDAGPDLFVILTKPDRPGTGTLKEKDYLSVAKLEKIAGMQRYQIPMDAKLQDYKTVAIWCRQFNATFGYAKLK